MGFIGAFHSHGGIQSLVGLLAGESDKWKMAGFMKNPIYKRKMLGLFHEKNENPIYVYG